MLFSSSVCQSFTAKYYPIFVSNDDQCKVGLENPFIFSEGFTELYCMSDVFWFDSCVS